MTRNVLHDDQQVPGTLQFSVEDWQQDDRLASGSEAFRGDGGHKSAKGHMS
jgi:hypothetical protein